MHIHINIIFVSCSDTLEESTKENSFLLSVKISHEPWIIIGESSLETVTLFHNTSALVNKFPKNTLKKEVKVVTVIEKPNTFLRRDALDASQLSCNIGLLCWVHENENRTKSKNLRPSCCVGFLVDLLALLIDEYELTPHIYVTQDGSYGEFQNGSWTGMIGDVANGKADMAMAMLTITKPRARVVDFTDPFMFGGIALAIRTHDSKLSTFNLKAFEPLNIDLWLVTFGLTLVVSIQLTAVERWVCSRRPQYSWKDGITYLVGLLFQRDIGGKNPHHHAGRTIAVLIAISTLIIMTTYTAVLTAVNISNVEEKPITGFRDPKVC